MKDVPGPIVPVILSGGSGTRLWPLSRSARPKQLIALTEELTMLQATARRAQGPGFAAPIIVAGAGHAGAITAQLGEVDLIPAALILEPVARNTAPAIALAALTAPDAILLVMPSDHVVTDVAAFRAAIDAALPAVLDGWLATFGIAPTGPETGYGYIQRGAPLLPGVDRALRFVEKPDLATAQAYLAEGGYAWNGGIFLFRAASYLEALERHAPTILAAVRQAMAAARCEGIIIHPDRAAFAASPADSIDYAVMEKSDRVAVAPVAMGWSDVGSWDALHSLGDKDTAGNMLFGEVLAIDATDCLIRSDGPVVAAIGLSGISIIATDDAVLVMPRGESQLVKRAVDALAARGHDTLHRPARIAHGWGCERHVAAGDALDLRLIELAAGRTARRLHAHAVELRLVSGRGTIDGIAIGSAPIQIAAGVPHRIANDGDGVLQMLETAAIAYFK